MVSVILVTTRPPNGLSIVVAIVMLEASDAFRTKGPIPMETFDRTKWTGTSGCLCATPMYPVV